MIKNDRKISTAVIQRLPRYYRYLGDLLDKDITRISSKELASRMGITASQIRQDLNNFGSFGQQGYGYNVALLYHEIRQILGLDKSYKMALIGAGNFGQALVNYRGFAKRGYSFIALFDSGSDVIGKELGGMTVMDTDLLPDFLSQNHVDIAVIALPGQAVGQFIDILASSNVKGVWNFSGSDLTVPDNLTVENVRLADSLMTLSYKISKDEILQRVTDV